MYKQDLKLQPSKTGTGVFTTIDIPANVPIMELRGTLYLEKDLPNPNNTAVLQISTNTFMDLTGVVDGVDYLNHSCNPNCLMHIVGNRVILYSMYVIKAGAELTFDYSTTSTDTVAKWNMTCHCGDFHCRKNISGFQTLDATTQQKMIQKGMVPLYITQPQMFPKKF
jgi:hypothetical protein